MKDLPILPQDLPAVGLEGLPAVGLEGLPAVLVADWRAWPQIYTPVHIMWVKLFDPHMK